MFKNNFKAFLISFSLISIILFTGVTLWIKFDNTINTVFSTGAIEIEINQYTGDYNWKPDSKIEKRVTVKNIGSNKAFVRVNLEFKWEQDLPYYMNTSNNNKKTVEFIYDEMFSEDWLEYQGYYYYKKPLNPNEETSSILKQLHFNKDISKEYINKQFSLDVLAEAVQVTNNTYKQAWGLK